MTHPHYYASTSRNLDRVLQYGVFPLAYMGALLLFRNDTKAKHIARAAGALASASLTTAFLGLESQTMDSIVRDAVTAEMGIDAKDFKTSDCKYSKNVIAREGYNDLVKLQPVRYFKDMLFLLPSMIEIGYRAGVGKESPISKKVRSSFDHRDTSAHDPKKYGTLDIITNSHQAWDMSIYMGTSAYWGYETFMVKKKSYYPIAQDIVGKIKPTDGNINDNHILDVYQRCRHDRGLPMIEWKEEHAALKPLIKKIVDAYNQHDGKIDIPEIVYLMGLNKVNIHGPDGKTVSAEAVAQSHKEIDRVIAIGLSGIREENRKLRAEQLMGAKAGQATDAKVSPGYQDKVAAEMLRRHEDGKKTFVDRFTDGSIRKTQGVLSWMGVLPKRPESYISVADPTELIGADSALFR